MSFTPPSGKIRETVYITIKITVHVLHSVLDIVLDLPEYVVDLLLGLDENLQRRIVRSRPNAPGIGEEGGGGRTIMRPVSGH